MQSQESAAQQEREVLYAAGPAVPVLYDGPWRPTLVRGTGMDTGKYKKIKVSSGWVYAGVADGVLWNANTVWDSATGDYGGNALGDGAYGLYMVVDVDPTSGYQLGPTLAAVSPMDMVRVQNLSVHFMSGGTAIRAAWFLLATFTWASAAITKIQRETSEHIIAPVRKRTASGNIYECCWQIEFT
jgi:hypothetical protein